MSQPRLVVVEPTADNDSSACNLEVPQLPNSRPSSRGRKVRFSEELEQPPLKLKPPAVDPVSHSDKERLLSDVGPSLSDGAVHDAVSMQTADPVKAAIQKQVAKERKTSQEVLQTLQHGKSIDPDLSYKIAAMCLDDALHGRDKHGMVSMYRRPKGERLAFMLHSHKWERRLFLATVLLHISLVLIQEVSFPASVAVGIFCLLVYYVDIFLKAYYMGVGAFYSKVWNRGQVFLTFLFTIDLLLYCAGVIQPFRFLRPWIFLCKDRELRRVYQAIYAMGPVLFKIFLVIAAYLMFFAAIGVNIFQGDYNAPGTRNLTQEADLTGSFDHFMIAFVRLFVLVTTENYPEVMLPAYAANRGSFFFFGLFLVIGVFYILPMLLAVVMESYWKATARQVKKDRKKERKKLVESFNYIDPDGNGLIELEDWLGLMKVIRPKLSHDAHVFLFNLLKNNEGTITALDWLEVGKVLKYKLETPRVHNMEPLTDKSFKARLRRCCRTIVDWKRWDTVILVLIALHWTLFCVVYRGIPDEALNAIHGVKALLTFVFLLDTAMRMIVRGLDFEYGTQLFGIPVYILELIALALTIMDVVFFWAGICRVRLCGVLGDMAQFCRFLYKSNTTLKAVRVLNLVWPLSLKLMILMSFVSFSYAVLGLELYHKQDWVDPEPPYCASDLSNPQPGDRNWNEFSCAWLMVFQIITTSNWHNLMNPILEQRSRWDAIFFISCFAVTNFVILSLMVGVFIDAFFKVFLLATLFATKTAKASKIAHEESKEDANKLSRTASGGAPTMTTAIDEMLDQTAEEGIASGASKALKERMAVNKHRRKQSRKKKGMEITQCVAIMGNKAHNDRDLPLTRGDVIQILERKEDRWRGKCNNRAGWFDADCVLPVLPDALRHKYEADLGQEEAPPPPKLSRRGSDKASQQESQQFVIREKGLSRRDMVTEDITNMNEAELHELNAIAKANLFQQRRKKSSRVARVTPISEETPVPVISVDRVAKQHAFSCDQCEKVLKSRAQLKIHKRKHAAQKADEIAQEEAKPGARRDSLVVPMGGPSRPLAFPKSQSPSESQSEKKGEMPDWLKNFAEKNAIPVSSIDTSKAEVRTPSPSSPNSSHPESPTPPLPSTLPSFQLGAADPASEL